MTDAPNYSTHSIATHRIKLKQKKTWCRSHDLAGFKVLLLLGMIHVFIIFSQYTQLDFRDRTQACFERLKGTKIETAVLMFDNTQEARFQARVRLGTCSATVQGCMFGAGLDARTSLASSSVSCFCFLRISF